MMMMMMMMINVTISGMANILSNCCFFFSFSGSSLRLFYLVSVICMLALMINKAKKHHTLKVK